MSVYAADMTNNNNAATFAEFTTARLASFAVGAWDCNDLVHLAALHAEIERRGESTAGLPIAWPPSQTGADAYAAMVARLRRA